jgi:hypothetical protein
MLHSRSLALTPVLPQFIKPSTEDMVPVSLIQMKRLRHRKPELVIQVHLEGGDSGFESTPAGYRSCSCKCLLLSHSSQSILPQDRPSEPDRLQSHFFSLYSTLLVALHGSWLPTPQWGGRCRVWRTGGYVSSQETTTSLWGDVGLTLRPTVTSLAPGPSPLPQLHGSVKHLEVYKTC